jgi:hypothetical protein
VAWKISIFLLLGLVFGIVAAIVTVVVRTIRREERQRLEREMKGREAAPPSPTAKT